HPPGWARSPRIPARAARGRVQRRRRASPGDAARERACHRRGPGRRAPGARRRRAGHRLRAEPPPLPPRRRAGRGHRLAGRPRPPSSPPMSSHPPLADPSKPSLHPAAAPLAGRRRRTVAERLLVSYLLVILAFAVTVGWSYLALSAAAVDADLL